MNTFRFEKTLTSKGHFDVIVVGGGVAGVTAAVSAARNGVSVLLIEKSVNLGGLATEGLISWYEPLCDGWEVSRVIPVCVLTGEAAGRAAALCVNNKKMLCDLNKNDIEK